MSPCASPRSMRASVGDLARDERPLSAAGVDGGDREPLPGDRARRRWVTDPADVCRCASRRRLRVDSPGGTRAGPRRHSRRCGSPTSPVAQPGSMRHELPLPVSPAKRSPASCSRGDGRGRSWERWTPPSSRQRSSGAIGIAAQQRVDRLGDVGVDGDPVAVLDLDDDVEGRRRLALQDGLLRPPAARLLVAQRHASGCRR